MRFVYLLSPGCDALWRRAGDLLLLGCLMHPPSSPLGCLHSRRRQNLCQLVGLSLRAFLSRGYRKPEARQGVAPLRQKVTGDALPWGAGRGRPGQQVGATLVAGATNVAPSQREASRGHMELRRRRSAARGASPGIGKSNGLFHRLRPPTPCHPAATLPADARAWGRPARPAPAAGQRWMPPAGRRLAAHGQDGWLGTGSLHGWSCRGD
jgi:hypothetical protein